MIRFADGPQASADPLNEGYAREQVVPAAEVPRERRHRRPRVSRELRLVCAGLVCGAIAVGLWALLLP